MLLLNGLRLTGICTCLMASAEAGVPSQCHPKGQSQLMQPVLALKLNINIEVLVKLVKPGPTTCHFHDFWLSLLGPRGEVLRHEIREAEAQPGVSQVNRISTADLPTLNQKEEVNIHYAVLMIAFSRSCGIVSCHIRLLEGITCCHYPYMGLREHLHTESHIWLPETKVSCRFFPGKSLH